MQTIEEIEKEYETPDPWGFQTNPEDIKRKDEIIQVCQSLIPSDLKEFNSALDLGCGEGWITKDLPAKTKYGLEVSENAVGRWPENVKKYDGSRVDLITAMGVLYPHYDWDYILSFFQMADQFIVTCNIKAWEVGWMGDVSWVKFQGLEQVFEKEFPYREFTQKLRVFRRV